MTDTVEMANAILAEFQIKLKTTSDYLIRYHRHRNNGGREVWDTDAAHAAYESCRECMAYLPASAKANAEILRAAKKQEQLEGISLRDYLVACDNTTKAVRAAKDVNP